MLYIALVASSTVQAEQESSNSQIVVAHGLLSRNGKAGTLWILKTSSSLKVRDETILQVTFTTRAGEASMAYAAYDGQQVELVGEVKEVFQGNAVLSKVRSIGILELPDLPAYPQAGALQPNAVASLPNPGSRLPYKHAYYLFLSGVSDGCEACYIPLLVSRNSLEEIAQAKQAQHCVFIYTYERNSIWEIKGAVPVDPGAIETQPRIMHLNDKSYRYQEVSPSEALRVLEKPDGTIPVSRPMVVNKIVPGASVSELITDFRALLRGFPANQN